MSTVSDALVKRDTSPAGLVEQYKTDFFSVLPSHVKPETWLRLAVGALRRDDKLRHAAESDPGSFMSALLHSARLGLEPGTEQYYLTPRKEKGQDKVLGIVGYQGLVELIYRAGAVSSVIVECVYDRDEFEYAPGRDDKPKHGIDWDSDNRGGLRLVYAYAVMKDGAISKVVVLNKAGIAAIKASSQGSDSPYSPWQKHEAAMWMKSAVRQLAKWVPTSAEYIREQLRAVADVQAEQHAKTVTGGRVVQLPGAVRVDTSSGEVLEGVIDDDPGMSLDASQETEWPTTAEVPL